MADALDLTSAYMTGRPESAGHVLGSLPAVDVARFLVALPAKVAVRPLSKMNAHAVALIVREMSADEGAALLVELGFAHAASILRQLQPGDRTALLEAMPRRSRRDFERSMVFPIGSVGAHMTTTLVAMAASETVAETLDVLKKNDQRQGDVVFIVDDDRKLLGAMTSTRLLRLPRRTTLADVSDKACTSISAHARLAAIAGLDDWQDYSQLPVVSRRGELIGSISRKSMLRASRRDAVDGAGPVPSLAVSMAMAITATTSGLLDLVLQPESSRPVGEQTDER